MTMMPANYLQAGVGLTPGGVILDLRGEIATMPNGQKYESYGVGQDAGCLRHSSAC